MDDASAARPNEVASRPLWWRALRQAYDGVMSAVSRMDTATVLAAAGRAGRVIHAIHPRHPSVAEISRLFDGFDSPAVRDPLRTARQMSELRYQNRALFAMVARHDIDSVIALTDPSAVAQFERFRNPSSPTILVGWHVGPIFGLTGFLSHQKLPVLALRASGHYAARGSMEFAFTSGGMEQRTTAVRRAVRHLKNGGLVAVASDGPDFSESVEVRCLGRAMHLARGPYALARMTGASIVPLAPRWTRDGRICIEVGSPLAVPVVVDGDNNRFEQAYAQASADWFETYALAHPGDLWLYRLRQLLANERVPRVQ